MEKIKLSNGQTFDLAPLGVDANEYRKRRTFKFTSELTLDEILSIMSNEENIGSIQYLIEVDEIAATYTDCVALKTLTKDIDTGVYIAELSTDAVERMVSALKTQIYDLSNTIVMMSML